MMIVYGSGGGQAVLGEAGEHECPGCKQSAPFSAIVRYDYFHIWYLFSFLTKRNYFLVCESCGCTAAIDAKTTRAQFPRDTVPFLRKKGWLLVLGFVALVVVLSVIGNSTRSAAQHELLAAPQVNDIYYADLARINGTGFVAGKLSFKGNQAFGVLKVREMDGDRMVLVTSMMAWNKKGGVTKEMKDKGGKIAYDNDEPVTLTKGEVRKLFDAGTIYEVRRQ